MKGSGLQAMKVRARAWAALAVGCAAACLAAGCSDSTPEERYRLGLESLRKGYPARGQEQILAALKLDPNVPFAAEAYNWLGLASLELGDPRGAVAYFEQSLKLAPDWYDPTYNLGCVILESGDVKRGVALLRKAADFDVRDTRALLQIGEWTTRNGRWPLATRMYQELLRRDPNSAVALVGLGRIAFLEEKPDEAVQHFEQALELEPDCAPALYNLGVLHARAEAGQAKAGGYFRRYLEVDPDGPRAAFAAERASELPAEDPEAEEAAKAEELDRLVQEAQALLAQGRPQDAQPALLRAQAIDPDNPVVLGALARCSVGLGQFDSAVLALRRILENDPENAAAMWTMAVLLAERLDMPARSIGFYRQFAARFPSDPRAAQVPARIRALEAAAAKAKSAS
jgi:tetratricopeptide (TPR) repeat protein